MTEYSGKASPNMSSGGGSGGNVNWGDIGGSLTNQTDLNTALSAKQNTLTAGSNITITNDVISATGSSLPSQTGNNGKFLTTDGTNASWATVPSGGLKNTATGGDSLTILGIAATGSHAVNIGKSSVVTAECTAVGYQASATNYSTAYGRASSASAAGALALGDAATCSAQFAIALGVSCQNTEANSFYVKTTGYGGDSYKLLDGEGKIPNDRISVDSAPTQNSTNFVTSGTIYSVLGDIETLINAL